MTAELTIPGATCQVKVRTPGTVAFLSLVTLGLYPLYWWYEVNREMRDLGRSRGSVIGESPGLSLFAFVVGGCLLIPGIWTAVSTNRRIQSTRQLVGLTSTWKVWAAVVTLTASLDHVEASVRVGRAVVAVLAVSLALEAAAMVCMQLSLNEVWKGVGGNPVPRASATPGGSAGLPAEAVRLMSRMPR